MIFISDRFTVYKWCPIAKIGMKNCIYDNFNGFRQLQLSIF